MELFRKLPAPMRDPPSPDHTSFRAYRASQMRNKQGVFPESELRQLFVANPDGTMGRYKASTVERWITNLESGVPGARIVDLPAAGHFVFLTKEADVLRELRAFMAGLNQAR